MNTETTSSKFPITFNIDNLETFGVSGFMDGVLRIYTLHENEISLVEELKGHSSPITNAIVLDQNTIASSDLTGFLVIWKKQRGVWSVQINQKVFSGSISDICFKIEKNKTYKVFAGCDNGAVVLCTFSENSEEITQIEEKNMHELSIISVTSTRNAVITCGFDKKVKQLTFDDNRISEIPAGSSPFIVTAASIDSFNMTYLAVGSHEKATVTIMEMVSDGSHTFRVVDEFENDGREISSMKWSRIGFTLSVIFTNDELEVYRITEKGNFERITLINTN